jgi:hypothetical protein
MRRVELSISIQSKPENIISAFTEFEMLHEWWAVERALVHKKVGGIYTLAWALQIKALAIFFQESLININLINYWS